MKKTISAILALSVLAASAAAAPSAAGEYLVELTLREKGMPVLSPRLTVRAGEPATFMKSDERHWVKLTATPQSAHRVSISFDRVVPTATGLWHDGSLQTMKADGEPLLLTAAGPSAGGAKTPTLEVEVRVRPLLAR